jgi:hypothetical protein
MAKLIKDVVLASTKGRCRARVLFDTGAWSNFVRRDVAQRVGLPQKLPSPHHVFYADGRAGAKIHEWMPVHVFWQRRALTALALVMERLKFDVVIGAATMEEYDMILEMRQGRVRIRGPSTATQLMNE